MFEPLNTPQTRRAMDKHDDTCNSAERHNYELSALLLASSASRISAWARRDIG